MAGRRARKAVITAAGRGTRQFPATRSIQKELLPLVDRDGVTKPTVQVIVEECLASGIEDVCVIVERGGQGQFTNHFRGLDAAERRVFAGKEWALRQADLLADMERRLTYVEQPAPEGFGHAVYQAREWVGDEPFLLLLGDHVYTTPAGVPACAAQLLDIGEREGGSVTSVRSEPESQVSVTGVVKGIPRDESRAADAPGQTYEILAFREKPTPEEAHAFATPGMPAGHYLCHFGLHLFTPEIFACLGHLIDNDIRVKNEIQLTSAQDLLRQRAPYRAAYLEGVRWDIGVPYGFAETQMALSLLGPFAQDLKRTFRLADGGGAT